LLNRAYLNIMLRYTEKRGGENIKVVSPAALNMGAGKSSGIVYPDARSLSYMVGPSECVVFRLEETGKVSREWYRNGNYGSILDRKRTVRNLVLDQAIEFFGDDVRLGRARIYIQESDPEIQKMDPGCLPKMYLNAYGKLNKKASVKIYKDDVFKVIRRFLQMAQYLENTSGRDWTLEVGLPAQTASGVKSSFPSEESIVWGNGKSKTRPSKVRGSKGNLASDKKGGAKITLEAQIKALQISLTRQRKWRFSCQGGGDEVKAAHWTAQITLTEAKIAAKLSEKKSA